MNASFSKEETARISRVDAVAESTPLRGQQSTDPFAGNSAGKPFWFDWIGPTVSITLSLAVLICFSVGLSTVNKELMNAFPFPCSSTAIQMAFTALFFVTICFPKVHFGSWRDTARWASIPPWIFGFQLAASLLATQRLTLAQQQLIKNLSPFLSIPIERLVVRNTHVSIGMVLALLVSVGGVALFFTAEQASPSVEGLVWLAVSQILMMANRLVERRFLAHERLDLSVTAALLLNNSLGLLPVGLTLLAKNEASTWTTEPVRHGGWTLLGVSCALSVGIGWFSMSLQKQISATSMLVVTNMNKVLVIVYGIAVLHEESSVGVVGGCTVALAGGLAYGYAALRLAARRKRAGGSGGTRIKDEVNKAEGLLPGGAAAAQRAEDEAGCVGLGVGYLDSEVDFCPAHAEETNPL